MTDNATPIRRQYLDIKKQFPDAIVFFRLGDFYETFDADAETAARELDIVLTSRNISKTKRVPMAGVPHHAAENYIARLIEKGYHVAVCEQVGDEPLNGLMPREVVRVVTPGTVTEPSLLPEKRNHYLVAVSPIYDTDSTIPVGVGLAYADVSTGEFSATQFVDGDVNGQMQQELARLAPRECLLPTSIIEEGIFSTDIDEIHVTPLPDWRFEIQTAAEALKRHFAVQSLAAYGLDGLALATGAAGALLAYLQETQRNALSHLSRITAYTTDEYMALDAATRRNLELTETIRGRQTRGSLLGILDRTVTAMGGRLLRDIISRPLLDLPRLQRRLDLVEALFVDGILRGQVIEALRDVGDIERVTNRILTGAAGPRELIALKETLESVPHLRGLLIGQGQALRDLAHRLDPVEDAAELIARALVDEPPATTNTIGLIRDGYSPDLDAIIHSSEDARTWINSLERIERERTGIKTLKVGYNKVFGYYIEITKANADMAPEDYIRKQTLVNAERYITPEMKEVEVRLLNADEEIHAIEVRLYKELLRQVAGFSEALLATARALARLDVCAALAEVAARQGYVRPQLVEDNGLDIRGGRHPVVEQWLTAERFVPNDTHFSTEERLHVITGPNMSGKCIADNTLIFTDQGLLPIEALKPTVSPVDEFVPLRCHIRGKDGFAYSDRYYNGGMSQTIRLETATGFVLEGTPEHPIWVRSADGNEGWKQLADIGQDDYVAIERNINLWGKGTKLTTLPTTTRMRCYPLPTRLNRDLAYLFGLLIGNTVLNYRSHFTLITSHNYLSGEFVRIMREQFSYTAKVQSNGRNCPVYSTFLRTFLAENGLTYEDVINKRIPECILRAPRKLVIAFLQGLFDTRGTADKRHGAISLSLSSLCVIRQTQKLLLNLGIVALFQARPDTAKSGYRLILRGEDAILFSQIIGFRLSERQRRAQLRSTRRTPNKGGIIPYLNPLLKDIQARIVAKKDKPITLGQAKRISSIFYNYVPRRNHLSYQQLADLIQYCQQSGVDCHELEEINARHYYYDQVNTITNGEAQVYDLSVPDGHSFIANGFISHNSTYLRQVALITLLAQVGSFVPADEATIGLVDRIFTRIGAQDEIHAGQSTFMVEMVEAAVILQQSTPKSLIILDEIGRGTSTYDGLAIARAVVEYLHNNPRLGGKTLFATHYHELTEMENILPGVMNYNVAVAEEGDQVVFLHSIRPGKADKSYGIHVAQLAGVPKPVVQRAAEILRELEAQRNVWEINQEPATQISFIQSGPHPVIDELRKLKVDEMSPIDAITRLYELQKRAMNDE
ncbi:MAG: DNA mismatch repair protein MutS [Anaerolineae bacterium]|nr:DNA mismatch repair protein MutS [Anaerolineae bacterium]